MSKYESLGLNVPKIKYIKIYYFDFKINIKNKFLKI